MKKVFIVLVLIIIVSASASASDKPIITVLDFSVDGVSEAEMRSIINILSSSLFKNGEFTVIDISQRENILSELQFSASGCTDESCYLEIGKMLSAEGIVVGSIGKVGSRYILTSKLIRTETGATMSTSFGMYKDLDELLDDIQNVTHELGLPFSAEEMTNEKELPNIKTEPVTETVPNNNASVQPAATLAPPEPLDINFPAWASLAGSLGCLGTGGYFLAVSLPLLFNYVSAQSAYADATDGTTATTLYLNAEVARIAAVDANINTTIPLGAGLSAAGIGLGILSILLFSEDTPQNDPPIETALLPVPGGVRLGFRLKN